MNSRLTIFPPKSSSPNRRNPAYWEPLIADDGMGDKDKMLVAYIMSQQHAMDLCFMMVICCTMVYVSAESFEINREEEDYEGEYVMENDSDSDASSLTRTLLTVTSREQLSRKMRRRREILSSVVTQMQTLILNLLRMNVEMNKLLCQFSRDDYAPERRRRVNGELMKLPGLSVRDRLRAATLLVSNLGSLNLFLCFPDDKKLMLVRDLLEDEQKS